MKRLSITSSIRLLIFLMAVVLLSVTGTWAQTSLVKPEDYGAVGDGITDDLAAIQAAVKSISAGQTATLFFSSGKTYAISNTVNFFSDTTAISVLGYGATLLSTYSPAGGFIRHFNSNISIRGLTFKNGAGVVESNFPALEVKNLRGVRIEDCNFIQVRGAGILVSASGGNASDIAIDNCLFDEVAATGIDIFGTSTGTVSQVSVSRCKMKAPTTPYSAGDLQIRGIWVENFVSDVIIDSCNFYGEAAADYSKGWRDVIMIGVNSMSGRSTRITIANCPSITGAADDGVAIAGAEVVTITGNTIYGSKKTSGVYCPSDGTVTNDKVMVRGNKIYNHPLAGIFLKCTTEQIVDGNEIWDCLEGIYINQIAPAAVERSIIQGNIIKNVTKAGISWDGGSASVIGNTIDGYGSGGGGIASEESAICGFACLSNSIISKNQLFNGIHGIFYLGSPTQFSVKGNVGCNLSGYGHYFMDFAGDKFIIADNILCATTGWAANNPSPSATKIIRDNM